MTRRQKRARATSLWIVTVKEYDDYVAATYLERADAQAFADRLARQWNQEYGVREITPESVGPIAWPAFVRVAL